MNSISEKIVKSITNRKADSHKGDYGRAFCVVGSYGMAGAAIISSLSCLRCGVGICDVALSDCIYPIVASNIPESVFSVYSNENDMFVKLYNGVEKVVSAAEKETTNNRMELMAVIVGLKYLKEPVNLNIYSDSAYVVNAFLEDWITSWQLHGWKNANKKPVSNIDLWQELLDLEEITNKE